MPTTATKRLVAKLPAKRPSAKKPSLRKPNSPKAPTHIKLEIDWSRRDAFLKLPLEERKRRIEAARAALAPAFADYSSDDFRADQRREAERDS